MSTSKGVLAPQQFGVSEKRTERKKDRQSITTSHLRFTIDDMKALKPSQRGEVKKYSKYVSKKYEERLTNEMIHVKVNAFIQQYLSADH